MKVDMSTTITVPKGDHDATWWKNVFASIPANAKISWNLTDTSDDRFYGGGGANYEVTGFTASWEQEIDV